MSLSDGLVTIEKEKPIGLKERYELGKYFGTDGVRGIANKELTPELAFKLGRVSGHLFTVEGKTPKVLIGMDPRISGALFEHALIAGLMSIGAEIMRLGVISTPATAYLTKVTNAELGIMISASHNPFEDNGIKLFGPNGYKLTDDQEAEIERLLDAEDELPRPIADEIGVASNYFEGAQKYLSYLQETIDNEFDDFYVVLDCANGATSSMVPQLFADLEAEFETIGNNPDGKNINDGVGSTHPKKLQELVVEKKADIGLAFDGDGDRLIAVDEEGNIVDGDQIMYICAKYLKENGKLNGNTVVATVMSNLGFLKGLEALDIQVEQVGVGDRHVLERMRETEFNFGGEQSGHIIFHDYNTTGDGILTGIQLLDIMKNSGKKLSELASEFQLYPQLLKNIEIENKDAVMTNDAVQAAIKKVETALGDSGRVLVRPSGTEPLIRVMIEAETDALCKEYANEIIDVMKNVSSSSNG